MSTKDFIKKLIISCSHILLPASIGFTVVVITLLMLGNLEMPRFMLSGVTFFAGAMLLYAGIQLKNRIRFFFTATFLLLVSILFLILIDLRLVYVPLPMIWPLLMFFIAMSFLISGFFKFRKIQATYIVLAAAFSSLGFVFLLFTTKIITVSFKSIALWWFPLFLLPYVFAFIVWLFQRKKSAKDFDE